jgi:oligoribonuclease
MFGAPQGFLPYNHIQSYAECEYVQRLQQPKYSTTWLWIDTETTNLDPTSSNFGILEVAAVITDSSFETTDSLHIIIHQSEHILNNSSNWCKIHFGPKMNGGNDLFELSRASVINEQQAGQMLQEFITKNSVKRQFNRFNNRTFVNNTPVTSPTTLNYNAEPFVPSLDISSSSPMQMETVQHDRYYRVLLAGSSVYFDRMVLLKKYPYLLQNIGHKTIDTTTILESIRRLRPEYLPSLKCASQTHRAMTDVLESVNIMRWYDRCCLPLPMIL